MQEEIEVLKQYVEQLGLHEKKGLTASDVSSLILALRDSDENGLADYVERLGEPSEVEEYIATTLYG